MRILNSTPERPKISTIYDTEAYAKMEADCEKDFWRDENGNYHLHPWPENIVDIVEGKTKNLCAERGHLKRQFPYLCVMCPRQPKRLTKRLQTLWNNRETDWNKIWVKMLEWK
jgi:hypothetical protein